MEIYIIQSSQANHEQELMDMRASTIWPWQ